jgi:hypothetical protein
MLNVASYDMLVHPRDNELVVGTHGRSVFVADVKPLQALKSEGYSKSVLAFAPDKISHNEKWGEKEYPWDKTNMPHVDVLYYIGKATPLVSIEVYDEKNNVIRKLPSDGSVGFHSFRWDLKGEEAQDAKAKHKTKPVGENSLKYVSKGKYKVKFLNGADSSDVTIEVK